MFVVLGLCEFVAIASRWFEKDRPDHVQGHVKFVQVARGDGGREDGPYLGAPRLEGIGELQPIFFLVGAGGLGCFYFGCYVLLCVCVCVLNWRFFVFVFFLLSTN